MQLDAVESGLPRAPRGVGKQARQYLRKLANVRQVRVGDSLASAHAKRLELACIEHLGQAVS